MGGNLQICLETIFHMDHILGPFLCFFSILLYLSPTCFFLYINKKPFFFPSIQCFFLLFACKNFPSYPTQNKKKQLYEFIVRPGNVTETTLYNWKVSYKIILVGLENELALDFSQRKWREEAKLFSNCT